MTKTAGFLSTLVLIAAGVALQDGPRGGEQAVATDCSGLPDGSACEDGAGCTVGESCLSGSCVAPLSLVLGPSSDIDVGFTLGLVVVSGDWNGDGKLDLAVDNPYPQELTILLGRGLGGFDSLGPVPVGPLTSDPVVGDWNDDGHLDLLAATSGGRVVLLLGDGLGHFSPAPSSPFVVGDSANLVAPGDWNGDTNLDFVVAVGPNGALVKIFLGDGSGHFSEGAPVFVHAGAPTHYDLVPGDWNGDGKLDLALTDSGNNAVPVLLGDGHGAFTQAAGSPISVTDPEKIAAGDWNGDGRNDLAVHTSSTLEIFLGNGSGGFAPVSSAPGSSVSYEGITVGDWNGDGKLDLYICGPYLGDGSGGFQKSSDVACGYSATAGDWSGDGKLDVAVTKWLNDRRLMVLLGTGAGTFVEVGGPQVAMGANPGSIAVGDFDGDGELDLASANFGASEVSVVRGNGWGGWSSPYHKPVGTSPMSVVAGDWDQDGKLDLATANLGSDDVTILFGDGTGAFPTTHGVAAGDSPSSLRAADLNRDGRLDLVVANYGTNDLTILLGGAGGTFSPAAGSPIPVGAHPFSVAAGDWNGDGKPDLAATSYDAGNVTVLVGNGSGGFSPAPGSPVPVGGPLTALAVGDWNGDGHADLVATRYLSSGVVLLVGNGAGGFNQAGSPVPVGSYPFFVEAGDWNGDGLLDVAAANYGSNSVSVLLGDGAGGFRQPATSPVAVGPYPRALAAADLNRDGRLDLAVANYGSSNLTILLNATDTAPGGTACSDGVPCTTNDTCSGFTCSGTPTAPSEVDHGVRVERSGTNAVLTWNLAGLATASDVLRGALSDLPVGPGGSEEVCVGDDLAATMAVDSSVPAASQGYWYLIRGESACGSGPYGSQGTVGTPGVPRLSTTCP